MTDMKPFSTYPEDRARLLELSAKAANSDDASAIELADLVTAILTDEQALLDAEMFDDMTDEFSKTVDRSWENFKAAIPVAQVINDNQPGRTAIIKILSEPATLQVGTKLFAAPVQVSTPSQGRRHMADTAKHTPGNWKAAWSKYREGVYVVQTDDPSRRVIASFHDDGDGAGQQSIADAHLIAAAPDLLEALKMSQRLWSDYGQETDPEIPVPAHHREMERFIEAAISKATGASA